MGNDHNWAFCRLLLQNSRQSHNAKGLTVDRCNGYAWVKQDKNLVWEGKACCSAYAKAKAIDVLIDRETHLFDPK